MESKMNHSAIESYSKSFSKKVCQVFFDTKDQINGYEILEISPINQVNLLVIKNIFKKWKNETAKLQSPFFDYQQKEVKKALNDFMNVLSKNISIKREHFEPILAQAVRDTIMLICSPYDFYSKEINSKEQSRVSMDDLKALKRYIKINEKLLQKLIERFEKEKIDRTFNDHAFELFNEICGAVSEEPEEIETYLKDFSKIIPLPLDKIYIEEESTATNGSLLEKAKKKGPTIHDKMQGSQATLSEKMAGSKVKSIEKDLSLNQRIMFLKELFKGEDKEFEKAIKELDQQPNYETAAEVVKSSYARLFHWDMDSDEVIEFMEMLANRYA